MQSALNWCEARGKIAKAPHIWAPRRSPPRDRVLSEDEMYRLIDACIYPHMRLFIILSLCTAGRHGTGLLSLTWGRINFDEGWINLKGPENRGQMDKGRRKGRAKIPMNNLARAALLEAKQGAMTEYVIEWDCRPVKSVKKSFRTVVKRAGLNIDGPDKVTPHTIRHTAATWAWESDVDPEKVAKFLGHKHPTTTRDIYAKPAAHYVKDATDAVDMNILKLEKGKKLPKTVR